mmetsp:Transcript_8391/g.12407  ORF Transcript_8391/g.12407 Transcript_8391/m.12407 type:complete len:239 (-) Transcript_8391:482-1198(-)
MFFDIEDEIAFEEEVDELFTKTIEAKMEKMKQSKEQFKKNLRRFADTHQREINEDPAFRHSFLKMCKNVGVDPLSSSKSLLGKVGLMQFYNNLAIQIIRDCKSLSVKQGGIILLDDLRRLRNKDKSEKDSITEEDIETAINKIDDYFHSGYELLTINNQRYLRSVPKALSNDHSSILAHVEGKKKGWSLSELEKELQWTPSRIEHTINELLQDGYAWIEEKEEEFNYWFPSVILRTLH